MVGSGRAMALVEFVCSGLTDVGRFGVKVLSLLPQACPLSSVATNSGAVDLNSLQR